MLILALYAKNKFKLALYAKNKFYLALYANFNSAFAVINLT